MDIVNGKTYRFINVYHDGYGLNIYGTKNTDIKGGRMSACTLQAPQIRCSSGRLLL